MSPFRLTYLREQPKMASVLANSDATLLDRGSNLELEVAVSILNSGYKPLDTPSWLGDLRERISALIFLKATMERKSTAKMMRVIFILGMWFMTGCGGGTTAPTNPPPTSNPVPAIIAITPSSTVAGSTDTPVTITGSGFISSSVVQWNGAPIVTTYSSATTLSATLPAGSLANATIAKLTVVNPSPGGGTSSAVDFSVNNPLAAITKINPASALAGSGDTVLDISGFGFVPSSVIAWNGAALTTTFVSATEAKATLPAADLTGSSASLIAVQNPAPGGGTSAAVTFTVNSPVPVISSISPRYVVPGSPATITVTGTGFESNSAVLWNGSTRPTIAVSTTVLQVSLSASDLQSIGTGSLTVSNPAPAASTSPVSQLTVTPEPVPVIQSVSIVSTPGPFGGCPQLQVTITGQNFAADSTIQANGVSLPVGFGGSSSSLTNYLPVGFISAPGALSFTVTNPDLGPVISNPFPYPATIAPTLALCATPSPTTVFANSSFSFTVQPSEVNLSSNGTLTLGSLPVGITSTNSSATLPPSGTTVHLQAASTTAAGPYDLTLNGSAGTATAKGDFNFTVSTGTPPSFGFVTPLHTEVGVPIGGSGSIQYGTIVSSSTSVDFDISPSVTGLPAGTTASFSPSVFSVGQSVTVTLSAASNAPVTQNASVTLTGTPSAQISNATASFFADVTQPPGSLPGNRTDFVPTAGTPYAAAYDATHNLIFSSNPDWNRVDVISNATHKIIKSIPVRSPRGLDITQDNSHVWVQSASFNVYAINTASLQINQYLLPNHTIASSGLPVSFSSDRLFALSDGTIFVSFEDSGSTAGALVAVWNPQTNQETVINSGPNSPWGIPVRSGDGAHVYATNAVPHTPGLLVYDVSSQSTSTINSGPADENLIAVNNDGSQIVLYTGIPGAAVPVGLFDRNLNLIGALPGTLPGYGPLAGGVLFSADNKKLYEIGEYNGVAVVLTIGAASRNVLGTAPCIIANSVGVSGPSNTATPFAIDSTGMVLGIQNYGISFDDSTFYQNYAVNMPNQNGGIAGLSTFGGPLSGGTVSSLYTFPALTPDVWLGQRRGSASISQGQLSFTSPPSATPGPVNVKFIYPDGEQAFYPQLFSYSTFPEYAVTSGSSPNGGAPAQVLGYGLPQDASGGTLTVGGSTAAITTTAGQYPPLSGEPYPSTILAYTFPAGAPGWADLQISTPIGSGALPKSIFYAKSVSDYSSPDQFAAVLVDAKRNQLYLAAGDHVDVFSTSSNQFVTPLHPAALGAQKQFSGLALTPDGSQLLVTDLLDQSLAVINPDAPSSTYAIPVPSLPGPPINGCSIGPLYVAATSTNTNQAFVLTGSLPAPSCPNSGAAYIVNLQTHAVALSQCSGGLGVDASGDGNFVVIGGAPCLYSVQSASYNQASFPYPLNGIGIAISADGNVVGSNQILADVFLNMLGSIAHPVPLYGPLYSNTNPPSPLLRPRLNASGSLYYFTYPNYFEIIDVAHATLRMRFSLTETIQNTGSPLAIDSGGRYIYLITDKGLTVVDFGAAPLSIGHLSHQNVSPGTQIIVRGSGFDLGTVATVGGVAASTTFTDENTLMLTVPAAPSGPQDIVFTRSDGETYTLENGVVLP